MTNEWITTIFAYLPTFLTALAIFVGGWIVARVVKGLVGRLANRLGIDGLVQRTGLSDNLQEANIDRKPSDIIAEIFFWLILLSFALVAFETMQLDMVVTLLQQMIEYFPIILASMAILIVGSWLAQLLGKFVQVTTASMGIDFHSQLGQVVRTLFMAMVAIIAIEQLGFDITLLTDLFRTMLTVMIAALGLAFGLGARDVARNTLAGFYARDLLSPGDEIVINGQAGTLEGIGSLNSEIETKEGTLVIPNSWITEKQVVIQSRYEDGISSGSD